MPHPPTSEHARDAIRRSVRRQRMENLMSVCGVLCSGCGAYLAAAGGPDSQKRVAEAWHRIYGLDESAATITCAGCLGPDAGVFHTCSRCTARRCCRSKGFKICAECPVDQCAYLEKAQSAWDGVPHIGSSLSAADFDMYARPYCGHRERLAAARNAIRSSGGRSVGSRL